MVEGVLIQRFWMIVLMGALGIVVLVPVAASAAELQAAGELVVNEIDLAAAALAYDSHTDQIYASVPASSALYPTPLP